MELKNVSLADTYDAETGTVYMTGNQALTRLALLQSRKDRAAGLNTAGYVTGYRGSPIGTYDLELERNRQRLDDANIRFQSGVNEDLAATAVWGTQQVESQPDREVDGVFALWYAKAPGVFRSGDPLRHGSHYGASRHGGVLIVPGDDHTAKSSTVANYSDPELVSHSMPFLYPANIQEVIDYGLMGWALSRFCGAWVGLKLVNETIEGTATVDLDPARSRTLEPEGFEKSPQVHYTAPATPADIAISEKMAAGERINLAQAFARANRFDRCVYSPLNRKLGIVCAGKSYQDVRRALELLGIDQARAESLGISLYKVAMPWPLEPEGFTKFAMGHQELLFVEEKQPLMEQQAALLLCNLADRPQIVGKNDDLGRELLPAWGGFTANQLSQVLAARLARLGMVDSVLAEAIDRNQQRLQQSNGALIPQLMRIPWFCSGCPHNRSTRVPAGHAAIGGIGCHAMAGYMARNTAAPCQMGGEGHTWVGMSHFVKAKHRFQNLGDGTYTHSGLLAVHAAVIQGVNITYKILYNDAVAMTGGQPAEGALKVEQISHQLAAVGVKQIRIVSDEPEKYRSKKAFAAGVTIHHRRELESLQRQLAEVPGVTAIINDQTCAAEKRRRRKKGLYPDPDKRVFVNEAVCDACGDCSVQSNCISIQSKKTEFGNKRYIDQSSCNKDYSCVDGFCPSFVTLEGAKLRKASGAALPANLFDQLPQPELPPLEGSYAILINGIGGTGVVTIGAVLGMAAHLEDKSVSIYDMTGLAQKGGAVQSHLRIADKAEHITATGIGASDADLVLGCDLVVTAGEASMRAVNPGHTRAVINTDPVATAALTLVRDFEIPANALTAMLAERYQGQAALIDATNIAATLTGNSIAANMFMVGYAFQKGWVPLSEAALMRAIELNGVMVAFNQEAFRLGRVAAHDFARIEPLVTPALQALKPALSGDLDAAVEQRVSYLTDYQNRDYAATYEAFVEQVRAEEATRVPGSEKLTSVVAHQLFRLMAYKDEYEVARLHSAPAFRQRLEQQFEAGYRLRFHLAPPLISRRDPATGRPRKISVGGWIMPMFRMLAACRGLRGSRLDLFGYHPERRQERELIGDYRNLIEQLCASLSHANLDAAVQAASLIGEVRGFGPVKEQALERYRAQLEQALQTFNQSGKRIGAVEIADPAETAL